MVDPNNIVFIPDNITSDLFLTAKGEWKAIDMGLYELSPLIQYVELYCVETGVFRPVSVCPHGSSFWCTDGKETYTTNGQNIAMLLVDAKS